MMPPAYYRELRVIRAALGICQKCGKADQVRGYSCCARCRAMQAAKDAERSQRRAKV